MLSQHSVILKRFPNFELSYETVSHKKVSTQDSVAIAIPYGRKYFIWHTYKPGTAEDACYLIGLDKDRQFASVEQRPSNYSRGCLGTIVYGTLYESDTRKVFLAEDIYYHCGVNLSNLCFGDRVGFLRDYIRDCGMPDTVALPLMWHVDAGKEMGHIIPAELKVGYQCHHIQYREIRRVAPYINVSIPKRGTIAPVLPVSSAKVAQKITATSVMNPIPQFDFSKPAFRYPAIFNITADPQLDLYHLYAYGGEGVAVYCGLAGVQSLKTSVFMNGLFRRIRENSNLDLAEESEDESDFENTDANKYVNLDAIIPVECVFNHKYRKWIPTRLARKDERISHIEKLVGDRKKHHRKQHSAMKKYA